MPTDHAILAPSASKRWMACAPSARLEALEPDKETSYAKEGTLAHSMAEALLTLALKDKWKSWPEDIEQALGPEKLQELTAPVKAEGFDDAEMLQTVSDYYCRIVWDDYLKALGEDPSAVLLIEQKLKLDEFIPQGFGSSDAILIYGEHLAVYDLKYGKGVKVDAGFNTQMMCYALGALCGPGEMYDIDKVRMTIIQPRLQWVSSWGQPAANIWGWAKHELRPAAVRAFEGTGPYVPGDHCRFCAIAPRCKAFAARATKLVQEAKGEYVNELMSDEEIADVLRSIEGVETWITNFKAYALEKALGGTVFPGFKIVAGKSNRQISDPKKAMQILADHGFDEESYVRPKELKTISDLEKLLKKKGFNALLGDLVIKPEGKPTLVDESDPRPAKNSLSSAANDFKEVAL